MAEGSRSTDRRQVLIGLGALFGVMTVRATALFGDVSAQPGEVSFVAYRDGTEIGRHRVRFVRRGDNLQVDIEIQFDVTFGFIPLYRYRHRNRELWQGDRLIELEARTDDDGTEYWVRAEARGDRLMVASSEGHLELPRDTAPTSYWNEASLVRGAWLDTQSGRLVRAKVDAHPPEPILSGGKEVEAKRYVLGGDIECELWYHRGRWVGLRFQASDGSTIRYQA